MVMVHFQGLSWVFIPSLEACSSLGTPLEQIEPGLFTTLWCDIWAI